MAKKITIYLLLVFLIINNISVNLAEEVVEFVSPRIPSGTEEYNPETPEDLVPDQLYAKSAILIEADTGEVIFEKNADDVMYPASTTKILTALLGIQYGDMEQVVTISDQAVQVDPDSSLIPLEAGETIAFRDLLYGTILRSGNEGANAIAETISGNVNDFVGLMNQVAQQIGCTNTHFQNPHGLHDDNHYTTVRDMAKIAAVAMENDTFRQIVSTTSYTIPKSNLYRRKNISNRINDLLVNKEDSKFYYPYANGIKTGFHARAGHCFVGSAEQLGVKLISVVFYTSSNGRWYDTQKLMNYGFSKYVSSSPLDLYNMNPLIIETSGFSLTDGDMGKLELDLVPIQQSNIKIITTKEKLDQMSKDLYNTALVEYSRDFRAPISAGETMGTLTYLSNQTGESASFNLVASRTIDKRENAPLSISDIEEYSLADPNIFPNFTVELLILWLIPPVAIYAVVTLISKIFGRFSPKSKNTKMPKFRGRRYK